MGAFNYYVCTYGGAGVYQNANVCEPMAERGFMSIRTFAHKFFLINPFLTNVTILQPLKTSENQTFGFLVFSRGIKWKHGPAMDNVDLKLLAIITRFFVSSMKIPASLETSDIFFLLLRMFVWFIIK